jgi:hypothetical protein
VVLLLAGFAISAISHGVLAADHPQRPMQLNPPRVYGWLLGGVSVTQWSRSRWWCQ